MRINLSFQTAVFLVIFIGLGLIAHTSLPAGELRSGLPSEESTIRPGTTMVVTLPAPSETRLRSVLACRSQ
jgi:hypothetical protein